MSQLGAGRTALITGASAGIGKAFAEVFARNGFNVILTGRREDRLHALAGKLVERHGINATVIPADIAVPSAPQEIFDRAAELGLQIDALVNNAGYGLHHTFTQTTWEQQRDFIQVLVTAVAHMTHLCLPGMIERGYGRIINIASVAGLAPSAAGHTLYGASKSFVIKFTESLHLEARETGVHVTAVCPGFTVMEFHDVIGNRAQVSKLPSVMWLDAATVAEQGFEASMAGKAIIINGRFNRFLTSLIKVIPRSWALGLAGRASKRVVGGDSD